MNGEQRHKDAAHEFWAKKFNDIDTEIAGLATICDVHLFDRGVIDRVIRNDATVCRQSRIPPPSRSCARC